MSIDELAQIAPPPSQPLAAFADRASSEAALGYSLPASAWEVIERWGDGSWVSWLVMPSPHHARGRDELQARLDVVRAVDAAARLVAYDDNDEFFVYASDGEQVWVLAGEEPRATEVTLPELLLAWLRCESDVLVPVIELTSHEDVAPYFQRGLDPDRSSHLFEIQVRGPGSREERWTTFSPALGGFVSWSRLGDGEARQDRVFVGDLELNLMFEAGALHVWCYDDRLVEVRARLESALALASMSITRIRAPRGFSPWEA